MALILFDFDGTIIDSQYMIVEAIKRAFHDADLEPPSYKSSIGIIGLSIDNAIQKLVPIDIDHKKIDQIARGYEAHYRDMREKNFMTETLFEDAYQIIESLHKQGHILGVATGKSMRGLKIALEKFQLSSFFSTLQTADHHPSKPHPSMILKALLETDQQAEKTFMIGDTIFDLEMAKNANVLPIGVTWGYHEKEELELYTHHIVDNYQNLYILIQQLVHL
jgi:phosphoglycolate phosphatase